MGPGSYQERMQKGEQNYLFEIDLNSVFEFSPEIYF